MAAIESPSTPAVPEGSPASRDGDRIVVWLRGEHDIATRTELSGTLARAMATGDGDLVVDLSHVHFMDCSAIGAILGARNVLRSRARSLTVRVPPTSARRVLDTCGLDGLVDPHPPTSEAAGAPGRGCVEP